MNDNRPVGWVAAVDLADHRTVGSAMIPLNECTLVSAESSIASVLQLIPASKLLFVVGKRGLSGSIVRSDLDRYAVRSYLFLLIAEIEMLLAEIVKTVVTDDQIVASLRSSQKRRFAQAFAANQETSPAEYLYIGELMSLFARTSFTRNPKLWDEPLTDLLHRVRQFRNDVMHPVVSLAALENIEALASLPRWATEVATKLRDIVTVLSEGSPSKVNQ